MSQRIRAGVSRLFRLALRRPAEAGDEMDAELRFHFEARIEQLVARGMSPADARAEALPAGRAGGSDRYAPGGVKSWLLT